MKRYTEYHAGVAVIKDKTKMKEAMQRFAELEERDSNRGWIPCSERLPEETHGRYYPEMIITTSRGDVKWGFYRVKDEEWYIYDELHDDFVEVKAKEVVAWQPLPEPYKPEEPKATKNTQQEFEDFWRDK